MAATVTIDQSYFRALLRRAELHTNGQERTSTPPNCVTITTNEYHSLLRSAREYNALKNALFRGGFPPGELETLLSADQGFDEETPAETAPVKSEAINHQPSAVFVSSKVPCESKLAPNTVYSTSTPDGQYGKNRQASLSTADSPIDTPPERDDEVQPSSPPVLQQRTILISNLSDRVTHEDLTDIIRGGRLLDLHIRNDRSALVSFAEGAQEFLTYAKRNDFYLHTKRLEVRWHDRQAHVPPHVFNKMSAGATRNLVVRGAAGKRSETEIREDLDHIHNLVVISVKFKSGDAYISTNSIANALFARTCMMSRTAYKGLRIEWYPDECASPLPEHANRNRRQPIQRHSTSKPVASLNPYNLLNDGSLEPETDEDEESFIENCIH